MRKGTLIVALMLGCWAGACSGSKPENPAIRTVKVYDMITDLPEAKPQTADPAYLKQPTPNETSIGKDIRKIIAMHAPSALDFPAIEVTEESVLTFGFAMIEQSWDHGGDGVEFDVLVRLPNGTHNRVFSKYIDPKHNADERRWFDEKVPLGTFAAAKIIQITLRTSSGPASDNNSDWAVWSEPQIVLGRAR